MYAVIKSGGKQHRVHVGDVIRVEKLSADTGADVVFDQVLMIGDDDASRVGNPLLDGVKVRGKVMDQARDKKILIYTFKRRQNSNRRRQGHRQSYTSVKIESIDA